MKQQQRFKTDENIVARQIAGEMLLVPVQGNMANMQRIFVLNPVAEYIWKQLDGQKSLEDIHRELLDEFDVERQQADTDMKDFIQELLEAELVVTVHK